MTSVEKLAAKILLALVLLASAVGMMPATSLAQVPASPAAPTPQQQAQQQKQTADDLNWLIGVLQDDQRRSNLIDALKARAGQAGQPVEEEKAPPAEKLVVTLSDRVRDASERALRLAASLTALPGLVTDEFRQWRNPDIRAARVDVLLRVFGAIVIGLIAEIVVVRLLLPVIRRFDASTPGSVFGRLIALVVRAVVEAFPVAAFVAAAIVALGLLDAPLRARLAADLLIYAHVTVRGVLVLARVLVAPGSPNLRLMAMTEETAHYIYIWTRRIAVIAVYGAYLTEAGRYFGLSSSAREGLFKTIGGLAALLVVVIVMQNRTAVARLIANEQTSALLGVRKALADVWHILVILYLVALFLVWLFDVRGGFEYLSRGSAGTLGVAIVAVIVIGAMKRIVTGAFRLQPDIVHRYPGLEARANRYLPVFREAVRVAIWLVALLFMLQFWGVRSLQWFNSPAGVRFVGTLVSIGLVVLVFLVAWESFAMALERYASRLAARGVGGARARTLLPLFRTTAFIVMAVLAGLVVLTQVGVDITPLLAGAGVVGLAVGFGSQKLVQDVINGVFILIEDVMSVGDVVDLGGGHAGVVESLSIRTIRLRDGNGAVHTIPFSEVKTVQNMTRDFARAAFEVEVAWREDVDRVIAAMKEVGAAVSTDPTWASYVTQPFNVIGVDKVRGSGVVIAAQISTLPGKQWDVGRAFNLALKRKFDEIGVEMPSGRVVVNIQGLGHDTEKAGEKKDDTMDEKGQEDERPPAAGAARSRKAEGKA
ncbi:MAG TPA: mechanosensitive ion channel domain-containing protein [Alphaproteobacteria bacterium]|jgi:small-conductance mechanosensitive channel|nr:mechanosensitive ion channel domain-containing protein [Alphaproteobacteria bacterium]